MNKVFYALIASSLLLSACGAPRYPLMAYPVNQSAVNRYAVNNYAAAPYQAYGTVRGTLTPTRPKEESKLIPDRKVSVPRSSFDDTADLQRRRQTPADPVYKSAAPRTPGAGEMPFASYSDFKDYVRYGYTTVYEDFRYLNETTARSHFSRYITSAYPEVQRLYKASRDEMKRFMLLDTLVNSLSIEGQALSYLDVHNPPAQAGYKLLPTQAAAIMPSFGEMVAYNRSSYEVNYVPWNLTQAARYYQANYNRVYGLIMEYGPSKQDAWRMLHREISAAAAY